MSGNWLMSIIGLSAIALFAGAYSANSQSSDPSLRCFPAVDGVGSGHGVFGRGTANARLAARSNWKAVVELQYGPMYDRFYMARDVRWNCNKLAILIAKCVVVAEPCGPPR